MPAFGRRTPQRQLVDGRPKRQAVLNRKETLDLTKGISKTESPIKSKEEASGKASPATNKNKNSKNDEKHTSTTQKIQPNKTNKKTTRTKKSPSTATRRSSRKKKSEDESEDTKNDKIEEEKVEEENPNEIKLNDDEKKNNTDSQNEETEDSEEDKESEPDDGEIDDDDDDFDPDEDPDKLWCFCKKTHGNRFMICCDTCEEWFHGECVGITMSKGREMEKTGEEWCCRVCKENAAKKQAKISPVKSALNSPLKKPSQTTQKPLDPATLTKARSLSLDSIKNNLGKKIKDRNLTLSSSSPSNKGNSDTKCAISENNDNTQKATDTPSKADKRKESTDKNSFSNLLTFDHVPKKKEEKATSYHRKGSSIPSSERRESIDIDFEKKRKDRDAQNKAKVRVTPTPKSIEPVKQCHRDECTKPVIKGSIYCSRECIYKYTNDSIKYLENERRKNLPVESSKATSKGTTIISPAHSTTDAVPMETTQERIAVFDKATGKVVAGVMAPTKKYLFAWLEEHPTFEVLKSGKQTDVRNPKKNQDEVVRMNVRKSLREVLTSRCKDSQISINVEAIGKLSKRIENELLKLFGGETNQKYKTKYRSLIFNLKDNNNKILYKRVVSGEINSNKLVNMSPEQLATPELARWREHESKHGIEMIKKRELEEAEMKKYSGVKKTHKGEVEIEGENENLEILEAKAEPLPEVRKASVSSDTVVDLLKDTTDEHNHHLFDSNCKICTGKLPPPGESQVTGVSTTVIQAIPESSVPSPSIEDDISLNSPPSPDTSVSLTPTSPKIAPPPSVRKQPSVWRGFVMMQKVAKFVCTAYAVSGTCENLMEILPDTIHVCGRIPPNQVWEYLAQLKEGRKESKYIDVIRFEMSSDEEKTGYIKLYTYFYTRQRIGVVGNCYSGVKDMYILPLASHDAIPNELKPLPGLPKPRPHMLVGIIVRVKKDPKKSLSDTMSIDSSPDSIAPKKKKKMKKEKEQLEKEKIEIEAQKKLIDIIFKNRSSDLANIDDAAEVTKELDPVSLLNSIASGSSTATTTSASKDSSEAQQSTNMGAVTGFGHDMVELKSEEEQLRLLREQQEEIDKLKAKLNIDKSTIMTTDTDDTSIQQGSEMETVSIPDPQSMAESLKDIKTLYQKEEKDLEEKQKETSLTDPVKSPDLIKSSTESVTSPTDSTDTPTDRRQYSISKANNSANSTFPEEFQDIYDASATAEIMREALQRTEKDEKDEASLKAEKEVKRLQIPLLGSMTSSSTSPMTKEIQPSDDDYVMNLIENIKIPTNVSSTQSPLEVLKNRSENKMPGLPAIDLPSSGGLPPMIPPPIPGVIPKVPIPPDIKLPPGVPFPPLPPPILASGPEPSRENSDAYETNDMDYRHRQPFAGPHNYDRPSNFGRHQNSGSHSRFDDTSRMDPRNQTNTSDPRYQNNFERPRHDYHNQGPDMNERPDFVDAGNLGYQNNTRDPRKVQSLTDGNFHPMGSDPNRPFDPQHSQSVDPEHNRTFGPDHGRQLGPDHKRQFGPDYNRPIVQDHNRYVDPNYLSPETHDRRMFSPLLNVAPEPEHRSLSWREYERRRNNQHEGDYLPPDQNWERRNDRDNILTQSQQPPLDNYDHRHVGPAHPGGQQLQNTFGTNYDNNNIHRQDIQPSADQFHQPLCNGPSNNRSFSREPPHHGPERFDNPRYPGPPPMPPFQPQNNQIQHMPPNTDNRMPSGGLIRNPNHGMRPDFRLPQQQDPQFQNIEVGFDLGTSASEVFPVRQPPGRDFQQPHVPTGQFHHGQHPPENVSQDPGFINKSFQPHPPMDMNMLRPSFPPKNQRFTTPSAFGSNNTNQEQSYGGFVESSGFHQQQQQQNTGLENPEQRFGNSNEPKPLMPQEFRPRGRKPWEREKDNYNNRDSGHRGRDNSRDRNDNKANRDKDRPRYNDDRQHSRQLQDYDRDRNRDNRRDRKRRYSDTENSNKDWKRNEPRRSDDERRKSDTSGSIVNQESSNETNANAPNFQQKQKREELEDGELIEHDGGDNQWKKSPANNRDSNWRRENNKDNGGYKPWKK